jgi:hypothetical protein
MSTIIAYTLPIVPGRTESASDFGGALDAAGLRERYEELNGQAGLRRHMEWVQSLPTGDVLIVVFETDAPERLARKFEDNDYDNWWRARIRANHGMDPAAGGVLPASTWSWEAGD